VTLLQVLALLPHVWLLPSSRLPAAPEPACCCREKAGTQHPCCCQGATASHPSRETAWRAGRCDEAPTNPVALMLKLEFVPLRAAALAALDDSFRPVSRTAARPASLTAEPPEPPPKLLVAG
jgi:hypothetical protein